MHYLFSEQQTKGPLESGGITLHVQPITLLVIDDHILVRCAIRLTLAPLPDIKEVIEARDCAEAEPLIARLSPDVILLDMPTRSQEILEAVSHFLELSPGSRIIALADEEDEHEAYAVILAGAVGYLSKQDVDAEATIAAIRTVCRGELALRPALVAWVVQRLREQVQTVNAPAWGSRRAADRPAPVAPLEASALRLLTAREWEVLQFISQGYRNRDIAAALFISPTTVHKHVQNILSKLGAQNRTEAAQLIYRAQLSEVSVKRAR
jgi:DNA-binding NarL/FixJ family response regulator